jgi:hypothetical protein
MKKIYFIILLIACAAIACIAEGDDVIILNEYQNKTYSEMLEELDTPIDKTGYTIKNAPTESWNHSELFSKYPKIQENFYIQIMEVSWDVGDYLIIACYHIVDGENRCLIAKKMKKNIRY